MPCMPLWNARRISVVGFVVAGALLVIVAWLSYDQMLALADARAVVDHTLLVREETEILLSLVKDAETGQRGFLITGDPQYLAPYETAIRILSTHVARMQTLVADNARQRANLDSLEPLVATKLRELAETIDDRRTRGLAAALAIVRTNRGKQTMDRIRDVANDMRAEESRLYAGRAEQLARRTRRATTTNMTGLGLAGALVVGATVLLSRANSQRDAERTTRQLAETLAATRLESETRLRVTLESIGDAVIAADAQGRVTLMNPVAQSLTGWTEAGAHGRPLEEILTIVNETTRRPVENPATKVLRDGRIVGLANHTILVARDGREIPIDDSAAPIKGPSGRIEGVVIVFRDVTAQRGMERQRALLFEREQEARRDAEAATRAKDEFVATLSHELRTPLNAIFGWVRVLRDGRLAAEASQRALDVIERNTRTQAQLIDDLLDVSRIITGKLRLEMRPVDLRAVVEASVDTVRPSAGAKGVRITTHFDDRPAVIAGDPDRLQQVAWNLLANAIRFTPSGGKIDVYVERRDGDETLRVSDTGRGIAPTFLPYVFDRFRQEDPSASRTHAGLGIGLALVRHLVEMHGGAVSAESAGEGRGATFIVRLPRMEKASPPPVGPSRPESSPLTARAERLGGLRVLIVDDETDTRELLRLVFEQTGALVTTAASVSEALAALDFADIDVLLSDIAMPGADGYELMDAVRARERRGRIPAVALTAYARLEDRERALKAGFQLHVAKPIDPVTVVRAVAFVCGRTDTT
jgi:PAS domain S-box-containing protein